MGEDQVARFENQRWSAKVQSQEWRHRAACELVRAEPVLDVGGGDGLLLRMLRDRGFEALHLVDVSGVAVRAVEDSGFDAQVADVTSGLPFPDGSFATVIALDVLEHLYDPLPAVRKMARVGAEVVLEVPNFQYWRERAQMLVGRIPFQSRPQRAHVHWFTPTGLRALACEAGLTIDAELLQGVGRLGSAGTRLARVRPDVFAAAIAVRARSAWVP